MSATVPHPRISPQRVDYGSSFIAVDTDGLWFLRELQRLLALEDYNGFTLQPTPHAIRNARQYLVNASYKIYKIYLIDVEFAPDGEGGIDIEWEHRGRRLSLSCRAMPDSRDFISWRDVDAEYDGRNASQELLDERLRWLIS